MDIIACGDIVDFPSFGKRAFRGQARVQRILSKQVRVVFLEGDAIGEEKKMPKAQMRLVQAESRRTPPWLA